MPSLISTVLFAASILGSVDALPRHRENLHDRPHPVIPIPEFIPPGVIYTPLPRRPHRPNEYYPTGTGFPYYPTGTGIPPPTETETDIPVPTGSGAPSPGANKVVTYFGQRGNAEAGVSLKGVCKDPSVDIVALGFVNRYAAREGDHLPGTNFAGFQGGTPLPNTQIFTAPLWEQEIQECQSLGKQVIISIGGAHMDEDVDGKKQDVMGELKSPADAERFADNIWKMFGEGKGLESLRPFGKAVVDGFDFDIENKKPANVPVAMDALRKLMTGPEATKEYVITAAPQCPRPDQSLLDAVYKVDYLFIQFYNNPVCAEDNLVKSFGEWSKDIKSKNPTAKIFAGVPGDGTEKSAGSGYLEPARLKEITSQIKSIENFGGLMVWEAVGAMENKDGDKNFLAAMRDAMA